MFDLFNLELADQDKPSTVIPSEPPEETHPQAPERPNPPPRVSPPASAGNQPSVSESSTNPESQASQSGLTLDDFMEAQKYAKYAVSALSYEDAKTAIDSMMKALAILTKND